MTAPTFDQLLARLVHADVHFVVIGGLALGSWGVVRGTKDCDIVPDPAPENLDRLAHLVAELGGHVQLGESLLGSEHSIAALLRSGERAFEDDDVLYLFDMREPADAAIAGQSPINREAGIADQRLESWFEPFTWTIPTRYLGK